MNDLISTFTNLELRALWELANERSELKIRSGVVDKLLVDDNTSAEFAYIGLKGEYAVCKFLDTPFDMDHFAGQDPGYDTTMDRETIQIKVQQSGLFFLPTTESLTADLAIKVVPNSEGGKDPYLKGGAHTNRNVAIRGWIGKQEFLTMCGPATIGKRDVVAVNDNVLRPVWTLGTQR